MFRIFNRAFKFSILLVLLLGYSLFLNAQSFYNVLKYGAKNDSSKLATTAISNAIKAASKAGGGTVYFPAGKYLTGAIHLRSNITIFIDAGAEIHFSDNFDDYLPMVKSRYEGVDVTSFSPLFYAYKVENISIIGRGLIDGHGKKWWDFVEGYKEGQPRSKWQTTFDELNKDILLPDDAKQMKRGFLRPPFIQPMFCKNIIINGITIKNSPFWTINPEFCENIKIHAVTISNPHSPNTDGINPESCKNVHISDCHISVGDDCITIKSGKDAPGRKMAIPAENYTITNCTMLSGHGGVVIGSEMSGDVRKIAISNCVFDGTDRGIRIKTARGRGGVVEDIRVSNIIMKNIGQQAIVLDMQYTKTNPEPVSERTPKFRNIHFSNITGQVNQAGYLNGLEEMPIENITFNDINMDAKTGFSIGYASRIEFHNVEVNTEIGAALSASNVNNLTIDNFKTYTPLVKSAVIDLKNVSDVFLYNAFPTLGTNTYLRLSGDKTKNISIGNNNFNNAKKGVVKEQEVAENVRVISGDKGQ
ncbi:glycoside hydrolase family 28 protein [Pedobacter jejuensis]|uniref:Glycoside hydrolase family 28 protein n=1 Tax=Pedobacter jejuensis TaxID=1268550 RepID=A0A3N0BT37_9SPHI|nr:glycoside hydrolase family 28 protein [Pedobacter jejuensis]RNL52198.1 glycoside hydrolase family 28 protein [Pedobacter jejuensis]